MDNDDDDANAGESARQATATRATTRSRQEDTVSKERVRFIWKSGVDHDVCDGAAPCAKRQREAAEEFARTKSERVERSTEIGEESVTNGDAAAAPCEAPAAAGGAAGDDNPPTEGMEEVSMRTTATSHIAAVVAIDCCSINANYNHKRQLRHCEVLEAWKLDCDEACP